MDEYWLERAERKMEVGDKTTDELLSTMKTTYKNSLKDIDKEIQAFYGRYAYNNNLDLSEVNKRLNPAELKSAKEEIKKYYDMVDPSQIGPKMAHDYRQELRLQSARAYMSRLEELKINLKNKMIQLGSAENKAFKKGLSEIYEQNYSLTNYELDKYKGFSTGFAGLNYKKLHSAISEKWLGENYSDRIWKNKDRLLNQLNTTFLQGVAQGHNPRKIATSMAKNYGTAYYNCERLARTESAHVMGQATLQGYKDQNATKEYEFVATLDNRTSEDCKHLDGKVFKIKEAQAGVNYPPMHPNCRSTTVPYFPKDEIDAMFEEATRVARDEDGKLYMVPADMTYMQWQKKVTQSKDDGSKFDTVQIINKRINDLQKRYDDNLQKFRNTDDEKLKNELKQDALSARNEIEKLQSDLITLKDKQTLEEFSLDYAKKSIAGKSSEQILKLIESKSSEMLTAYKNQHPNATDKELSDLSKNTKETYFKALGLKIKPTDSYYKDENGKVFKFTEPDALYQDKVSNKSMLYTPTKDSPANILTQARHYEDDAEGIFHINKGKYKKISEREAISSLPKWDTLGGVTKADEKIIQTYSHFTPHNSFLRKGGNINELSDAKKLKDIIDRTNSGSGTYYRGITGDYANKLKSMKVGETITDKAFVSTSADKEVAEKFAGDSGIVLVVKSKGGIGKCISVGSYSEFAEESEYLFNVNTKMKITNKTKNRITVEVQ